MFRSFEIIDSLVRDLYGVRLMEKPMPRQLGRIEELGNACRAITGIVQDRRKPFTAEFVRCVYPVLEVAVQWSALKDEGKLTQDFLERCRGLVNRCVNVVPFAFGCFKPFHSTCYNVP